MTRRPLVLFFALAFALPWAVWATSLLEQAGAISWHLPSSLAFWVALPVATFAAAALTGGWPAVRAVLVRMIRVRVRAVWWLLALALTPATTVAVLLWAGAVGARVAPAIPVSGLVGTFLLDSWMFLLSEEPAWRGFALPRMERRMPPLAASAALGVVWALWHVPLFLMTGSFQASLPFVAFALSTVATSVTLGWVFHGARGSVLVAALFHAATDTAIAGTGVMTSGEGLLWTFVAAQCLVAVGAGIALARAGRLVDLVPAAAER